MIEHLLRMMDIKSPDVVFLGSTFEESDPRVINGRYGEAGSRGGDAEHPTRSSASMKKAHFMDKHPIRTSVSMRKAHFMDKHPIRSSASMRKAHFMDEHPTRSSASMRKAHLMV